MKTGDVLIAIYGATSGDTGICQIDGAINQAVLCVKTTENKYFLKYSWGFHKESIINTYLQGGQGKLSSEIVKSVLLRFPKIEEQNKIATLLESIDLKIKFQKDILLKYILQKNSLLQTLFI